MNPVQVTRRTVGVTSRGSGREVVEYVLDNGRVRVRVWSYGATLVAVEVPGRHGGWDNLVLRQPDLAAYEEIPGRAYVGSTMGRFARIVARSEFVLGGDRYQLTPNACPDHIHGGVEGFDARVWDDHAHSDEAVARVVLTLVSPDGDQGYPGTLTARASYELDAFDRLTVELTAETDARTICGLSTHTFWNLSGEPTVDNHLCRIAADRALELREDFVPTGRVLPVDGTFLDFRAARALRGTALDTCLVRGDGGTWAVHLYAPASGRSLEIHTDQPGLAIYTGDHLPGRPRAGICVQPGPWPDSPNRPDFPSAVLAPGETYRNWTRFDLDHAGMPR